MDNLALTTVVDFKNSRQWRSCAKLWTASLLRHQWGGSIRVKRNFPQPLFPVSRADLQETAFTAMLGQAKTRDVDFKSISRSSMLDAAEKILDAENFKWILIADADCIALRNPDHLFVGDCDVLVSMINHAPDPGIFAVRGSRFHEFVSFLKMCGGLTETGLCNLVRSNEWKIGEFERGEVLQPSNPNISLSDLGYASIIHFKGMKPEDKQRMAFAFHMMSIYGDKDGLFFDIMEA